MNIERDYTDINRQSWNQKIGAHVTSEFYDLEGFLKGKSSLNDIELNLLGDVRGKSILHLQCHFGQDTISLNRLGAKVTGVDFSDKAIDYARELSEQTHSDTTFLCCDIYDLPQHVNEKFDIVFTSYGTISWLPDLDQWAKIISSFLKPHGKFVFVEFHPVLWMFDYDFVQIAYSYFNSGPMVETETGSYADKKSPIKHTHVVWNHSISDVINSLIKNGLVINQFDEFDYSPYNCFNKIKECGPKTFRIEHLGNKIPMVFSLVASKSNDE